MTLLTEQIPNFVFKFKITYKYVTSFSSLDSTEKQMITKLEEDDKTFSLTANIVEQTEHKARNYLSLCLITLNEKDGHEYGMPITCKNTQIYIKVLHIELIGDPIPVLISCMNMRMPQGRGSCTVSLAKVK